MIEDQTKGQRIIDFTVEAQVAGAWVPFSQGTTTLTLFSTPFLNLAVQAARHPARAVGCAILSAQARWMLIGACDPML